MPDNEFVWTQEYFPSADGTELHADVFRPAWTGEEPTPVIVSVSPYYNHAGFLQYYDPGRTGAPPHYMDLWMRGRVFERGYAWVMVSLRGYGGSAGCGDLGGAGEQSDVKAAVEWAASRPWSTGRVAVFGKSYEGWTAVMALATSPAGLAAAIILSPLLGAYRTLYSNGVPYHYLVSAALTPFQIASARPCRADEERYRRNALGRVANVAAYAEHFAALVTRPDPGDQYWRERDLVERAAQSEVPVLWSHGFWDTECHGDNILPVFGALRGPKRAWFGHFAHDSGYDTDRVGRDGFLDEAFRWLDRHLKCTDANDDPPVVVQDNLGRWRAEISWPPADAVLRDMEVRPGAFVDEPGNGADAGGPSGRTGVGTWSISSPLAHDAHLAGEPVLEAEVSTAAARANLFAILYDLEAAGLARIVTRGASVVRGDGVVRIQLFPTDWRIAAGHRLALLLAGSEDCWWQPPHSGATVEVRSGRLRVPFLRVRRGDDLDGGPSGVLRSPPEPFAVDPATITGATIALEDPPPLVAEVEEIASH